jgi:hypothetical protein
MDDVIATIVEYLRADGRGLPSRRPSRVVLKLQSGPETAMFSISPTALQLVYNVRYRLLTGLGLLFLCVWLFRRNRLLGRGKARHKGDLLLRLDKLERLATTIQDNVFLLDRRQGQLGEERTSDGWQPIDPQPRRGPERRVKFRGSETVC